MTNKTNISCPFCGFSDFILPLDTIAPESAFDFKCTNCFSYFNLKDAVYRKEPATRMTTLRYSIGDTIMIPAKIVGYSCDASADEVMNGDESIPNAPVTYKLKFVDAPVRDAYTSAFSSTLYLDEDELNTITDKYVYLDRNK